MRLCLQQLCAALMCLTMASSALGQAPLGTGFTYQGRLKQSGAPVNTTADLQFGLFNASTGGTQLGTMQAVNNASVADGYFGAALDFGVGAFNGEARWLQIAVRSPAGSGTFVTLTPRQPLTATPYALKVPGVDGHSLDAADGSPTDALFVTNNGDVGIGTTGPVGKFEIRSGTNSYVRVDGVNGDVHMNGGSDAIAGICNDSTGANARLDFVVNNASQMVVNGGGHVGIGTLDPLHPLDVRSNLGPAISAATAGHFGAALTAHATASMGNAIGVSGGSSSPDGRGVHGLANATSGVNYGVLGESRSTSGYDFFAAGDGVNYGAESSRRWKRNLEPIDDPLRMLARMRGVYFDWDEAHGGHHDVGMIAEEVGKVLPEVVAYEENGIDASGMDYSKLTPLLVEAIKAQQTQIEGLHQANAELRELVSTLMKTGPVLSDETGAKSK